MGILIANIHGNLCGELKANFLSRAPLVNGFISDISIYIFLKRLISLFIFWLVVVPGRGDT